MRFPKKCPCPLKTEVVREVIAGGEQGARAHCTGEFACPFQRTQHLMHFVSRRAFDIDGLGEKQIELFYENGWVKEPADIFTLAARDKKINLKEVEGYGETSVRNLYQAIEARREHFAGALHLCARHPPRRRDHGGRARPRLRHLGGVPRRLPQGRRRRRGDQGRDGRARPDRRDGDRGHRRLFRRDAQPESWSSGWSSRSRSPTPRSRRPTRRSPARPWCSPARWKR